MSGLKHVLKVLDKVEGISFTFFGAKDIVRHPLVQRIVVPSGSSKGKLKILVAPCLPRYRLFNSIIS
jgi:phosphate starvation-inducible protein PhoH